MAQRSPLKTDGETAGQVFLEVRAEQAGIAMGVFAS
jgi:hypothetical protein